MPFCKQPKSDWISPYSESPVPDVHGASEEQEAIRPKRE